MLHTYRHTDRPSDEAGPRGTFAPKNLDELDNFKKKKKKLKKIISVKKS